MPHLVKLQAAAAKGKTRVTMYLDDSVLDAFRSRAQVEGKGDQTLINDTLKQSVITHDEPMTEETLRRVIREELRAT